METIYKVISSPDDIEKINQDVSILKIDDQNGSQAPKKKVSAGELSCLVTNIKIRNKNKHAVLEQNQLVNSNTKSSSGSSEEGEIDDEINQLKPDQLDVIEGEQSSIWQGSLE